MLHDLRFALRVFAKRPLVPVIAVLTLGIGIGACTAVFGLVRGVLMTPLPFPDAERIVSVFSCRPAAGWRRMTVSIADALDWQEQAASLSAGGVFDRADHNLSDGAAPEMVRAVHASAGLVAVLGVSADAGSLVTTADDATGLGPVVMLSSAFWHRHDGADPGVVGRSVDIDGVPHLVLGVLPSSVRLAVGDFDVWIPFDAAAESLRRSERGHRMLARLAPGFTRAEAEGELRTIAQRLEVDYPATNRGYSVVLQDLSEAVRGPRARSTMLLLAVAVIAVLLIACVNIANLLLASAADRSREFAVRAALGAHRAKLLRQMLAESILLAAAGGGLGVVLAGWWLDLMLVMLGGTVTPVGDVGVDWRTLLFAAAVLVCATVGFGLPAALRASSDSFGDMIRASSRPALGGRTARLRRGALVVAQVALALALLVNAMLMIRSARSLQVVDPGFQPVGLVTGTVTLPAERYGSESEQLGFVTRVVEELAALPTVRASAAATTLPLIGDTSNARVSVEGRVLQDPEDSTFSNVVGVTPGYFGLMGIPLLAGRDFSPDDHAGAPPVVVVNRFMARQLWPDSDAVGRRVKFGRPESDTPWMEVVGVVDDVRHSSLQRDTRCQLFAPMAQLGEPTVSFVLRADDDVATLRGALSAVVAAVDPELAVFDEATMVEIVDNNTASQRQMAFVLSVLSGVALLLAVGGLYGVVAFTTSRRTPEIGLRLALGAGRARVLVEILHSSVVLVLWGVSLGSVIAWLVSTVLDDLLFGIAPFDPMSYAAVAVLMVAVGLLAALLPARRASRVDPAAVLRWD